MKIIFLDIDGVLNYYGMPDNRLYLIDRRAVETLNLLIEKTGAKIVISSTWRLLNSLAMIKSLLIEKGFKGEIVGKTPSINTNGRIRGDEIQAWLEEHPDVKEYVILDDDSDMGPLKGRLVKVDGKFGLLTDDVTKAIEILQKDTEQ